MNEHSDITARLRDETIKPLLHIKAHRLLTDALNEIELLRVQLNEARSDFEAAYGRTDDLCNKVLHRELEVERLRAALTGLVAACEAWDDPGQPHTPRRVIAACATARALVAPTPEPHPTPRTHRVDAGGAGAGHSLPSAGSDLDREVRPGVADHLVMPVAAVPAVLADPGDRAEPLVGVRDLGVVIEPKDDGEVTEQAVAALDVHVASPCALGSAHHKRDTSDGEATGIGCQPRPTKCERCKGAGIDSGEWTGDGYLVIDCPACGGSGTAPQQETPEGTMNELGTAIGLRVHDTYEGGYGTVVDGPFPTRGGLAYRVEWDRPTPNQATARPVIPSQFFEFVAPAVPCPEETP